MRSHLPNGASLLVEPAANSKSLYLHLLASSRLVDQTKEGGLRHLLEHLCVGGKDDSLDDRLEREGGFLRARTLRDVTDIEIDLPPDKLQLGLDALQEILNAKDWTQDRINHEVKVIGEEIALAEPEALLGSAAWKSLYGEYGADPIGDIDRLQKATPAEVEDTRKATFATSNLVLVIEGPITLKAGMAAGTAFLAARSPSTAVSFQKRVAVANPARTSAAGFGEARGVPVPGISDPMCAATLAAALALATEMDESFVTYTPSLQQSAVIVGETDSLSGLTRALDKWGPDSIDELFGRGKLLVHRWALRQLATPNGSAFTRGLLMAQDPEAKFESFENRIENMTLGEFRSGFARLAGASAAEVVGS